MGMIVLFQCLNLRFDGADWGWEDLMRAGIAETCRAHADGRELILSLGEKTIREGKGLEG
jgi:hypothetical protein